MIIINNKKMLEDTLLLLLGIETNKDGLLMDADTGKLLSVRNKYITINEEDRRFKFYTFDDIALIKILCISGIGKEIELRDIDMISEFKVYENDVRKYGVSLDNFDNNKKSSISSRVYSQVNYAYFDLLCLIMEYAMTIKEWE